MAKLESSRPFPHRSADQVYAGFEHAFTQAGFRPLKLRPIGWLALAQRAGDGGDIQANLSARPGNPTTALLIMTGDRHAAADLQPLTDAVWQALAAHVESHG